MKDEDVKKLIEVLESIAESLGNISENLASIEDRVVVRVSEQSDSYAIQIVDWNA